MAGGAQSSAGSQPSERDPSGFVTNPPTTVVKVAETARDDINGLLGLVVSYNMERQRYLVHMTKSQSTMAFKPENLVKGSMLEQYKCQWQQLKNDPRVRQKVAQYLREMQHFVAPARLSHIMMGCGVVLLLLFYFVGFMNTILAVSMLALLAVIAGPDIVAKKPPALIAQNFPNRARVRIEEMVPALRGKLSNKLALGIVAFMVAMTLRTLYVSAGGRSTRSAGSMPIPPRPPTMASSGTAPVDVSILNKYYEMGFQDAKAGAEQGSSIPATEIMQAELKRSLEYVNTEDISTGGTISDDSLYGQESSSYDAATAPPPSTSSSSWFDSKNTASMTNAMSMFYLYRNVMDLGMDSSTGFFSIAQLAANVQHLELWRQGLLAMSVYRVLRIFF